MRDIKKVQRVVKQTLSEEFQNIRILNIDVHDDVDSDGAALLRIDIVFEGMPRESDVRTMAGAIRYLRPALSKIGESAFPLLSFISEADAEHLKLDPA